MSDQPSVTSRVTFEVCYLNTMGGHNPMMPVTSEEAAKRGLAKARNGNHGDRWHAHRIEQVTTTELLDW